VTEHIPDTPAERFLDAIRHGRPDATLSLLEEHPDLAASSMFTAAAAGDSDRVVEFLQRDASLLHATHAKEAWTPLAYACASPLHQGSSERAEALRRVVGSLLDAGASPNSGSVYWESGDKKVPISALYHACMSDHVALVELLLVRGATTEDGESIYHAAQHNRRACLERLLAHGADLSSAQSPYGNTPLYFLVGHHDDEDGRAAWCQGLAWLLEHGADPNVVSDTSAEAPLHRVAASHPKVVTARALLAHGAHVNARRGDGRTPYPIAVRHGNTAIAALLLEHGADTTGLEPTDEFLGACLTADGDRARALVARHPDLREALKAEERHGGTPLHWAAWLGKPTVVQVLLDLGAPINVRDCQYGASPLGWAAHGSECHAGHDDRYCAIVDLLVDAGAEAASTVNKWGEQLQGSPRVAERLRERGILSQGAK
jgi:ankyrin repeat protein